MFWAVALKPGASHTLPEGTDLLHVSQACIADAKEGKCQLQVNENNITYTIAVLEKDKTEMASIDLFFNTVSPPTFINKGKSEIHLSGYFEMSNEMDSEDEGSMGEEEDEEIESELEEEEVEEEITTPAAAKAAVNGITKKSAIVEPEEEDDEEDEEDEEEDDEDMEEGDEEDDEDDEEDDEEEEDDDEEDDEDDEEDDEEDDDEEEDEEEKEEVPAKSNNKRPAPVQVQKTAQPAAKNQKVEATPESFVKAVVTFLKSKDGKASISAVGGSVQKPAGIPKLKQFLVSRKEFKITADTVELA